MNCNVSKIVETGIINNLNYSIIKSPPTIFCCESYYRCYLYFNNTKNIKFETDEYYGDTYVPVTYFNNKNHFDSFESEKYRLFGENVYPLLPVYKRPNIIGLDYAHLFCVKNSNNLDIDLVRSDLNRLSSYINEKISEV